MGTSGKMLIGRQRGQNKMLTTSAAQTTVTAVSSSLSAPRLASLPYTALLGGCTCQHRANKGEPTDRSALEILISRSILLYLSSRQDSEPACPSDSASKHPPAADLSPHRAYHAAKSTLRRLEAVRWHPSNATIGAVARGDLTVGLHDPERDLVSHACQPGPHSLYPAYGMGGPCAVP